MEPHYVTFEQAKKLKEKGFDYMVNNYFQDNGRQEYFQPQYRANYNSSVSAGLTHSRPEHWQVINWLLEKHGIWVSTSILRDNEWHYTIRRRDNNWSIEFPSNRVFKTPQEAYSAAFDYIL